ncbi:MAG: heavy-metal-associated domain-containing protein [Trueperaceae bacterium]|nr:heavy-metal-associated domain-containing protein [Trueperaceae bacterium]
MIDLHVEGMTCGHCTKAVETALAGVDGVTEVHVDLETGRARVDGGDLAALVAAVQEEGYTARPAT